MLTICAVCYPTNIAFISRLVSSVFVCCENCALCRYVCNFSVARKVNIVTSFVSGDRFLTTFTVAIISDLCLHLKYQ